MLVLHCHWPADNGQRYEIIVTMTPSKSKSASVGQLKLDLQDIDQQAIHVKELQPHLHCLRFPFTAAEDLEYQTNAALLPTSSRGTSINTLTLT